MEETFEMLERSAAVAGEVLPFMTQHKIPLTPENYKVWFEYHFGGNEELERDIGEKKARGIPLDKRVTEHLYDVYFVDKNKREVLSLVQNEAKRILSIAIENVLANINDTTEFNSKLHKHTSVLRNVRDLHELIKVVENIITDTSALEKSNLGLQKKLEETTVEAENIKILIEKKERGLWIDPLTGLSNRRSILMNLRELFDKYKENGTIFSVIMLDIDFFNQFNDNYGHVMGDQVLQIVSATLNDVTKGSDFVGRYGGEEFTILLPMTSLRNGVIVAEHIRKAVLENKLTFSKTGESIRMLSVSLGVAQICTEDTTESVLERADAALTLAKQGGRNNVKSEQDLSLKE